jgi:hypothetical protein
MANYRPMDPSPRVHEGFRYRLAGEVGSTKVMLTGKAESWKDRAKTLPEVTLMLQGLIPQLRALFCSLNIR